MALPPRVVDNHALARVMDTDDAWIVERSGIRERRYVERGVASSDLGAEAVVAALADARMAPDEVDYLVCATMTPDHHIPGAGTLVQYKAGLPTGPALDSRQQCAGFAYGLQLVDALIGAGTARNVVLVGCDVHTSLMPYSQATWDAIEGRRSEPIAEADREWNNRFRHLLVLFADAAGAMVFRASTADDGRGILASRMRGDGEHHTILETPGGGSARRPWVDIAQIEAGETVPVMDGRQVFKLAVTRMPEVTLELLAEKGLGHDDLDLIVMHQANLRINEAAQKQLGVPASKVFNNIERYGNTTSATLPLAFHEARAAGLAPPGALVAFTALGAGLHWGAVLMRV